ncbi:RidA family protein [Noviherbaspirillum massiliense]|uniref:RidA family protein n=1 Tax=Noviherbaspirillum massiliense TaxID=1465823 RepID=UPI0003120490|nr:RidA family protein [Noviherbaspirillum massiliense]
MTTMQSREEAFQQVARELGHSFDGEMRTGGNYVPAVEHGDEVYVSGQIPRVGDMVVVTGRVGKDVSLEQGRHAAKICAMRALAILRQTLGNLDRIRKVLRITVYVQCAEDFTQQSEVADGASEVLHAVLSSAGRPTRTSVGVYQLPKNAPVEIDMIVAVDPAHASKRS